MSGLDEIRQIFEEEALEGLDTMESGLLNLETGDADPDIINDIFRAAHSIKGGSATFGFQKIADFTHIMETLLDLVRDGEKQITPDLVQLFLECVDCLRDMMAAIHTEEYDEERIGELSKQLEAALPSPEPEPDEDVPPPPKPEEVKAGWRISFIPHRDLLTTGNQPLHIMRALGELGELKIRADVSRLPDFAELDPEELHIAWEIDLAGSVEEAQIREVFEWVEEQCDLTISPLNAQPLVEAPKAPERRADDRRQGDRRDPKNLDDQRKTDRRKKGGARDAGSIRVGIDKIDSLLNLVGELVITQAMLSQFARDDEAGADKSVAGFKDTLEQLTRNTRELQEACMQIRMLPVSVTFSRFPRLVHDLSSKLGKDINLKISGEQTELDKTVLEKIGDPLVHLIRNSLDHGIESAAARIEAGKPAQGTIHVSAAHESGNIVIRVQDDGGGLNTDKIRDKAVERGLIAEDEELTEPQVHDLIFRPGFSTADVVSDVSGRGVGMDVVRSNIEEIGGRVEVVSQRGEGSTFSITLPLTLAILDGQIVRVGEEIYILPLLSIIETVQIDQQRLNVIAGESTVYRLRGNAVPVVQMQDVLKISGRSEEAASSIDKKLLVIVESGRNVYGLAVDELLEQQQVVIKSLETNLAQIEGLMGATILGDGTVALIADITGLLRLSNKAEPGARLAANA